MRRVVRGWDSAVRSFAVFFFLFLVPFARASRPSWIYAPHTLFSSLKFSLFFSLSVFFFLYFILFFSLPRGLIPLPPPPLPRSLDTLCLRPRRTGDLCEPPTHNNAPSHEPPLRRRRRRHNPHSLFTTLIHIFFFFFFLFHLYIPICSVYILYIYSLTFSTGNPRRIPRCERY